MSSCVHLKLYINTAYTTLYIDNIHYFIYTQLTYIKDNKFTYASVFEYRYIKNLHAVKKDYFKDYIFLFHEKMD